MALITPHRDKVLCRELRGAAQPARRAEEDANSASERAVAPVSSLNPEAAPRHYRSRAPFSLGVRAYCAVSFACA